MWHEPHAQWFAGGQLNASYNCLDRHLDGPRRDKAAIIWEGEPGDSRVLTYPATAPRGLQVRQRAQGAGYPGRRSRDASTCRWCPSWPSPCWPVPASARVHSVVFGGFSADAVADRNNDAKAKLVITADGGWRRGKVVPLKHNVDAALAKSPTVEKCIVFNRCNQQVDMKPGRDLWWHELMADASADCPADAARQRTSAVHPLHQRLDRQTQGRAAHDGRLSARRVAMLTSGSSTCARTTFTGAPPTSAG